MATKNDEKWMANYKALKAHVAETGHFPDKHSRLNNWARYQRKCIKADTLEDWKRELFEELADSRSSTEHTGGRKKKTLTTDVCQGEG